MQLKDVLQVIWKRRLLVVLVVVATTVFSAAFALHRSDTYESTSTIALTPVGENAGFVSPDTLNALVGTYAQTAKSQLTLGRAEKELGKPLPGHVETANQPGTGILQITGVSETPDGAAETATAVSKAFIASLAGNKIFEEQVVDPAEPPLSPAQTSAVLIIIIGFILGLFAGAVLAYFVEQLRGRIESAADIADITPLPIIGALPNQKRLARSPSRLVWDDLKLTGVQEALRALRTNIEILIESDQTNLLITSPLPSEGKSMIVANLGVAFSQVGIETLIVDADLRRPRQHEIFGVSNDAGLSTALSGGNSKLRRARTPYPGLTLLPSGPIPPHSTEMLHVRGASLFESLRGTGALVLIDSPPIIPVSDSRILASRADGVILTVAAGQERPAVLRSAIDMLKFSGASALGIVLNRSSENLLGGGYDGYHPPPAARAAAINNPESSSAIR